MPSRVYQQLLKRGVIVRPVANYGLPEWLRITVGLPAENERLLRALADSARRRRVKLALIGVGLIGGSFAIALRAARQVDVITGFDSRPEALQRAFELGVIDRSSESAARAIDKPNLVMIATPVGATAGTCCAAIAPHLGPAAIVTDVGSTKTGVIETARHALGRHFRALCPAIRSQAASTRASTYAEAALFNDKVFVSVRR